MSSRHARTCALAAAALLPLIAACAPAATPPAEPAAQPEVDLVARGAYLVNLGGCDDCHSPKIMTENGPEPDMSRRLSGHPHDAELPPPPEPSGPWVVSVSADLTAWSGPWGRTYPINLTPDETTGIKIWTEEMFIGAMRTGKHMGTARPIMPPMPWFNFGKLTDEDLKAILAFLKSLPPISNENTPWEPAPGMEGMQ